jgi:spermidine synthase
MSIPASFDERVAPGVRVAFDADRVLYQAKSAAHEKIVIENAQFGRVMMIDGIVQLSSADEFIYHEMMSHVPLLAHGRVERVLIVGGGDCGLAEEVLKHHSVRSVIQVEIDPQVVKLGRAYFSGMNAAVFRDRRFQLRIADGAKFVASTNERFDLILIDSTDPGEGSLPLFTETFYRHARGCLRAGGVIVAQIGVPFLQPLQFAASLRRMSRLFPIVSCYLVPVPCIFGGPLAFGWASSALRPDAVSSDELVARLAGANIETRYYTPELHRAAFALPRYLQEVVDSVTRPEQLAEVSTG